MLGRTVTLIHEHAYVCVAREPENKALKYPFKGQGGGELRSIAGV